MFDNLDENMEKFFWLGSGAYSITQGIQQKSNITKGLLVGLGLYSLYRGFNVEKTSTGSNFPDVPIPPGSVDSFKVNSIMLEIYGVLNTTLIDASDRCKAYERYNELNNSEFITVHNNYKNNYGSTIKEDMSKTYQSGCSYFSTQFDDIIINRMNQLGI